MSRPMTPREKLEAWRIQEGRKGRRRKRRRSPRQGTGKAEGEARKREVLVHLQALGISPPAREYRFHPVRRWRFDWAWPVEKVALEYEGGTFTDGDHVRGPGYEKDCEKYSEAAIFGWCVIRVTNNMVADGRAADLVERALESRHVPRKTS